MECLLQYWDNLDDLYWQLAAQRERVLSFLGFLGVSIVIAVIGFCGFQAGVYAPTNAIALCALLGLVLAQRGLRKRELIPG